MGVRASRKSLQGLVSPFVDEGLQFSSRSLAHSELRNLRRVPAEGLETC